jgi:hypothetical protein
VSAETPATSAPAAATQAAPVDDSNPVGTLKWVVGGLAVAGLVTGGVLLGYQKYKADQYTTRCMSPTVATMKSQCDSLHKEVTVALWNAPIIAFSVGGGLAAIATVLFVVDATDDSSTAHNGCGVGGPGELGVQCRLAF